MCPLLLCLHAIQMKYAFCTQERVLDYHTHILALQVVVVVVMEAEVVVHHLLRNQRLHMDHLLNPWSSVRFHFCFLVFILMIGTFFKFTVKFNLSLCFQCRKQWWCRLTRILRGSWWGNYCPQYKSYIRYRRDYTCERGSMDW